MKRLAIGLLVLLSLILIVAPSVLACEPGCGCSCTIKVIPVHPLPTQEGDPLVTSNPADLMIFHTGRGPIKNVWLLIVLNKATYDNLDEITIGGLTFMTKADFALVTAKKIPPTQANPATGYPGSLCQYEVYAIKDKMDEKGNPLYYGVKFFLDQITTSPTYFTLDVKLSAPAELKALILALGRRENNFHVDIGTECVSPKPFDTNSCFSKSTFVVPEIATIALSAAPFAALGAFGIFAAKRRKK